MGGVAHQKADFIQKYSHALTFEDTKSVGASPALIIPVSFVDISIQP